MPQSESRLSSRQQSTWGSELCSLGRLHKHRGSHLATDKVLRNDRFGNAGGTCTNHTNDLPVYRLENQ